MLGNNPREKCLSLARAKEATDKPGVGQASEGGRKKKKRAFITAPDVCVHFDAIAPSADADPSQPSNFQACSSNAPI